MDPYDTVRDVLCPKCGVDLTAPSSIWYLSGPSLACQFAVTGNGDLELIQTPNTHEDTASTIECDACGNTIDGHFENNIWG